MTPTAAAKASAAQTLASAASVEADAGSTPTARSKEPAAACAGQAGKASAVPPRKKAKGAQQPEAVDVVQLMIDAARLDPSTAPMVAQALRRTGQFFGEPA